MPTRYALSESNALVAFSCVGGGVNPLLYRQPLATKTASKLSAGRNDVSGTSESDTAAASLGQSDNLASAPDVDDLASARAQLRARAGARGRRSSRPSRVAGGHGQVNADLYCKEICAWPQRVIIDSDSQDCATPSAVNVKSCGLSRLCWSCILSSEATVAAAIGRRWGQER